MTLKAYLSRHPKPRAVVLCVTPFCFEVDIGTAGGDLPEHFVANYGPEVEGVVPIRESIAYFMKRGAVSLVQSRDSDVFNDPLTGFEKETYRTLEKKMRDSRGFFRLPEEHGPNRGVERPGPADLVHQEWDQGVRQIAQACDEVGVVFVIRFSPISAEFSDARDFSRLESWGRTMESSYSHLVVARPILLAYAPQFMWDCIHLNSAGVEKFMPTLVKDVRAALGR